jgi:hypothetical protein
VDPKRAARLKAVLKREKLKERLQKNAESAKSGKPLERMEVTMGRRKKRQMDRANAKLEQDKKEQQRAMERKSDKERLMKDQNKVCM